MSCNRHLKSGWLNLNDSVVVKEYTECLSEYLNEDVNNKHTAIMKWYTMWKDDRERRMSNGEKFYVFNVLDYMEAVRQEAQQLEDIRIFKENQSGEANDNDDIYA